MVDIELVIKIPEDSYKATCNGCMLPPDVESVVQGIKNGITLPKGHGRLKDVDALEGHKQIQSCGNGKYTEITTYYQNDIDAAQTIIEANV